MPTSCHWQQLRAPQIAANAAGDRLDGPAVIEELGATILVYPGDKMQVNEFGHLVIEVGT